MKRKIKIFRNNYNDCNLEQKVNDFIENHAVLNINYLSNNQESITVIIEYKES